MATVSEGNGILYHHVVKNTADPNAQQGLAYNIENGTLDGQLLMDVGSSTQVSENEATTNSNDLQEPQPEVDIVINNVVCSFNCRCHLNLRKIALNANNVEFKRENSRVIMKTRNPYSTATIWSSGKVTCTGSTSEEEAKKAARRVARILQKLGFTIRFCNYRVVNVLGTCTMPFGIKIIPFSQENRPIASYEPELYPGVTYRIKDLKATLKIFSTGSITITAPSIQSVQQAVEFIFPLVYEFRKEKAEDSVDSSLHHNSFNSKKRKRKTLKRHNINDLSDNDENLEDDYFTSDEDCWD